MERRKCPRLRDNIFISYHLKTKVLKAITQDISGGGLMFGAEKKIRVGSELELEVYQPVNHFKSLIFVVPVLAKVVWMKKIKRGFFEEGENVYRIGLNFTRIKDEDRQKIRQYIEENRG